ncbi:MAG: uroporphyrinogen decarboxylase [Rickettsiaceae bacterium H1]|nr:uroporphyrinogen decarboxylase [Rickettsiaceae bacterium H1]
MVLFEEKKNVPIWFMRQAGRYIPEYKEIFDRGKNFFDVCHRPELSTKITMQPIKRFDLDAAIIFSDILTLPHALGCDINFIKNVGPIIKPITTELNHINYVHLEQKLKPVFFLVEEIRKLLPKEKSLIGFAGSPWTVLAYLIEGGGSKNFAKTREFFCKNEEKFSYLTNKLSEATIFYLSKQIKSGADVVQLFDSWAGILPAEDFFKWVIRPTKKIVSTLKNEFNNIKIIGFPKGAGSLYIDYVKETGIDGISVDYTVSVEWIRDNLQPLTMVQGNLDPFLLAYNKKKALLQAEKILSVLGKKHFIFNLGHGIIKETPVEHVEELVKKVKCWNKT